MPLNRRKFLKGAIWLPAVSILEPSLLISSVKSFGKPDKFRRVRPGDPHWPAAEKWEELNKAVNGNLIKLESPLTACKISPGSPSCHEVFKNLRNPYYISDEPAFTQISGWHNAWTSKHSVYAVAAKNTSDVVAAVNFARINNLRLVIKGGGHSLLGTSNASDSLLVWTSGLNEIVIHDKFIPTGCEEKQEAVPAVTVGAGALWMDVYDAVTTKRGKYVQGSGCTTVSAGGLIQSGGFGSFSKTYGLAAAGLLEAEIVTADGSVKIVNACNEPDLFWALKGGGGGSFGIVTKLTLKTRPLPKYFGAVFGKIKANSDKAFKNLIARIIDFYNDELFNSHWGEQIRFYPDNSIQIQILFHGLNKRQAKKIWDPFEEWINAATGNYTWEEDLAIAHVPARRLWDASFYKKYAPQFIATDDRPGKEKNIYWKTNTEHAAQYLLSYHSAWLPSYLLEKDRRIILSDALFSTTRHWAVSLQFNKGLGGAPQEEILAARDTAMNPAVLDAFALAIVAGDSKASFPGIAGHEPDINDANDKSILINKAMDELRSIIPQAGSYVSESNFFEKNWQRAAWGSNYDRLLTVKKKYDPEGLFFVYHGVGSEEWSDDGFIKVQ